MIKRLPVFIALGAVLLWANNTSLFQNIPDNQHPRLLAHRGVHHVYDGSNRAHTTCRAPEVEPITHSFIENTIPSMQAAFDYGADVVEIDVHLTTDSVFAVFHDWTLDCQTDGTGVTEEQDFAYLQTLDIGYNISSDGIEFPLRGKAIGAMPALAQVFEQNLDGKFLINFKSKRSEEGEKLAEILDNPTFRNQVFGVYGGAEPTRAAMDNSMGLGGYDLRVLKDCVKSYVLLGWSGYVPKTCRNRIIAIPNNYAPFLWGWPHKFTNRMKKLGTDVILLGPYHGGSFSNGIDDLEQLAKVPRNFDGYVWTNKIEQIGPIVTNWPESSKSD